MLLTEDENEFNYLTNMNSLLTIMEIQPNLHNWVLIASKYHDLLKAFKTKTSTLNVSF